MKILRVSIDRRRDDKPASGIEVEALGPLAALLSGLANLWGEQVASRCDLREAYFYEVDLTGAKLDR